MCLERWVQARVVMSGCGTIKTKGKWSYEYDKWTVMRIKTKLRECEEYISILLRWIWRGKRER